MIEANSRLFEMLARHEGYKRHVYICTGGKRTVGIGRNLDDKGITREEAEYLLGNDILEVIDELHRIFPWYDSLTEARKHALIDMGVNLGINGLLGFRRMLKAMSEGNYGLAAVEAMNSKWARQVGSRATEISDMIRGDIT